MSEMVELSRTECLQQLERGGVGRLAFMTPLGLRIVPLNFATNPDVVVFRTEPDSELARYGEGAEASFEIDEIDPTTERAWRVVAFGRLERPSSSDEVWDIRGWRNPTPWAEGARAFHLKLRWTRLTGRRLLGGAAST